MTNAAILFPFTSFLFSPHQVLVSKNLLHVKIWLVRDQCWGCRQSDLSLVPWKRVLGEKIRDVLVSISSFHHAYHWGKERLTQKSHFRVLASQSPCGAQTKYLLLMRNSTVVASDYRGFSGPLKWSLNKCTFHWKDSKRNNFTKKRWYGNLDFCCYNLK